VPDVAGDADPSTGYQVRVDGTDVVYGGTSAVAPLWAALVCRLAQALGRRPGFLPPLLYGGTTAGRPAPGFRDITSGSNGAYTARPGWDACTGLGVPDGEALLARLRQ
jgi:kumamolisin